MSAVSLVFVVLKHDLLVLILQDRVAKRDMQTCRAVHDHALPLPRQPVICCTEKNSTNTFGSFSLFTCSRPDLLQ